MNREEAVKHLTELLPHYEPEIYAKDTLYKRQAIQFAISALNAEKGERCPEPCKCEDKNTNYHLNICCKPSVGVGEDEISKLIDLHFFPHLEEPEDFDDPYYKATFKEYQIHRQQLAHAIAERIGDNT